MNPNATDTMVVIGNFGDIWYRTENGEWVKDDSGDIQSGKNLMALMGGTDLDSAEPVPSAMGSSTSSSDSLSKGAVAGISVTATLGLCTLIVVVVFTGFSIVRKKKRGKGEDTYLSINEESAPSNPQESNI